MATKYLDIKGPVVADTVYDDGHLVAKDVAFTLPGLEFVTATVQAMGNMEIPVIGMLENMEVTITKVGQDKGLKRLNKLEKHTLEFRWAQTIVKKDGTQSVEGCKAFVRTIPTATPEISIEPGNATSGESRYGVSRIRVVVAGEEWLLIDRLSQILKVNGKDYMSKIQKLL